MKRIFISAGEHSGDQLGSHLYQQLKHQLPNLKAYGIGGHKMKNEGIELIENSTKWSSIGAIETLKKLPYIILAFQKIKKWLSNNKVDLFIAIDCRVLNEKLINHCYEQQTTCVYFTSPTKWWFYEKYQESLPIIKKLSHIYPSFQKEANFYDKLKVKKSYIGHPLKDILTKHPNKLESINSPCIGLFPGSRGHEIKNLYPVLCKTALLLQKKYPEYQFITSIASKTHENLIKNIAKKYPLKNHILYKESSHHIIQKVHFSIACSGSISIEHILFNTPCIITYIAHPISALILNNRLKKIPFISWPNIFANKKIIPEYIQADVNTLNLSKQAIHWIENKHELNHCINELKNLQKQFGKNGCFKFIANHIHTNFLS